MPVRILIADDHEGIREGVRAILHKLRSQWEICGEAVNGQEAINAATLLKPDLLLLDVSMPGMSGLDAASRISRLGLAARILIFTMHDSGELAGEAYRAGARGFVTTTDASRHLVLAIETLLAGGTFFGQSEKRKDESAGNPVASRRRTRRRGGMTDARP